ncbi:uncharacterized protein LOC121254388 isoform X4 [Juglans microcarpa x Juglans regia]|uniref:uncharacterized protein LOC121254388 isoform X4 n=1 Tax=Juglans microcarpa x Juglans regia TaxID=2249226 RepID=UPI001B7E4486|nr:uncharacterized protein LOC121254388 isoform X4 [Juglans microcarpa x Juglans regia]
MVNALIVDIMKVLRNTGLSWPVWRMMAWIQMTLKIVIMRKNPQKAKLEDEILRENLERIVGTDDSTFSGIDLANLIRDKYGRSYDVQLIKKEFMGRNLLALNVMWKYMEQRSFPLTEEEYLLRLDDVANTLKCWGAVSHIRNSLAKLKERPRIGKAVSIFIDMDESGGRANEWIYK